jgi:twitching motility protein PilT
MLASQPEVSDLLFTVDRPPQVESYGELKPVVLDPPIEKLTPFQTETIALNIIGDNPLADRGFAAPRFVRLGLRAFGQGPFPRQHFFAARQLFHRLPPAEHGHPTLEKLKLPDFQGNPEGKDRPGARHRRDRFRQIHDAGGHPERNQPKPRPSTSSRWKTRWNMCIRTKRRRSTSANWALILTATQRPARRAAPGAEGHSRRRNARPRDGENRLERGGNRASGLEHAAHHQRGRNHQPHPRHVRAEEQEQIRIRLADSLRWVVSQRLAPKSAADVTRCLKSWDTTSARGNHPLGESEGKTFYEIIEASHTFGWRTFDHACLEAYEQGIITEETALLYCTKRGVVSRGIDNIKKERGEITSPSAR